jgi:hypothetical protein
MSNMSDMAEMSDIPEINEPHILNKLEGGDKHNLLLQLFN